MNAAAPQIDPALTETDVVSFTIDSRNVNAGDVFFALSQPEYAENGFNGDFDDATVYVPQAFGSGAAAAVVRRDRFEEHRTELDQFADRIIFAEDVIRALQDLAHRVYLEWNGPVVAVTGSAGKTTAKELTAHVLAASGKKVLRNIRNYNNGLGHPLTVLNLVRDASYDVAVLEMGMSTPMNEIARLCRITPPDVAVELNVLPVHLEHLGSIDNIAKAKAELVEGMKVGGTAVLNSDDVRVLAMKALSKGSVITYGVEPGADVSASDIRFEKFGGTTFLLTTPQGSSNVSFALNGKHNILNALAAAAVGHSFGMGARDIAEALSTAAAPSQRGEIVEFAAGFSVINDSYNSNPAALMSMVQTLVDGAGKSKRRILVAGEMLELGPDAAAIHRETGRQLGAAGIDMLIGVRGFGKDLVAGAKESGLDAAMFAEDSQVAGEMLASLVEAGDAILIKGSRGVKTEKVLEVLSEKFEMERSEAVKR